MNEGPQAPVNHCRVGNWWQFLYGQFSFWPGSLGPLGRHKVRELQSWEGCLEEGIELSLSSVTA